MAKLTKKELKLKKQRLKKMREAREKKVSNLERLDLTKLENVLRSKYDLSLNKILVKEQDYFTMNIKEVLIEVVLEKKDLKVGVNLGQMNFEDHETSSLFSVIERLNQISPLADTNIELKEMDNYYYLKLSEPLLMENSTEEIVFDTIENLIEVAKSPVVLGRLAEFIES